MKKGDLVRIEHFLGEELLSKTDGKVMWIVEDEVSIQQEADPRSFTVFDPKDTDYKVTILQESAPSFQSQVASLSDEELREAVNSLRGGRIHIPTPPKTKKAREPKLSAEELQLSALMASMTPEEQQKLKEKLGL